MDFTDKYCMDCHDSDTSEGDLNLEILKFDLKSKESFKHWLHVYDRVETGEMPPKKKKRPNQEELPKCGFGNDDRRRSMTNITSAIS